MGTIYIKKEALLYKYTTQTHCIVKINIVIIKAIDFNDITFPLIKLFDE